MRRDFKLGVTYVLLVVVFFGCWSSSALAVSENAQRMAIASAITRIALELAQDGAEHNIAGLLFRMQEDRDLQILLRRFRNDFPGVPLNIEIPSVFYSEDFFVQYPKKVGFFAKMCKGASKKIRRLFGRGAGPAVVVIAGSLAIDAALSKKVAADYPDWAKHKAPPSARKRIGEHTMGFGP